MSVRSTAFVSIDLDYWCAPRHGPRPNAAAALDYLRSLGVPYQLVVDHHQMLPFVNAHRADVLVNVDRHDDLMEGVRPGDEAFEGDWVGHVQWAAEATYLWAHCHTRESIHGGLCNGGDAPWGAWRSDADHRWGRVRRRGGRNLRPLLQSLKVRAFAICVSPGYLYPREQVRWFSDYFGAALARDPAPAESDVAGFMAALTRAEERLACSAVSALRGGRLKPG